MVDNWMRITWLLTAILFLVTLSLTVPAAASSRSKSLPKPKINKLHQIKAQTFVGPLPAAGPNKPSPTPKPTPSTTPASAKVEPAQPSYKSQLLTALNNYRSSKGVQPLSLDSKLADFAQSRADLYAQNGSTDNHAGFQAFMAGGGFDQVGFNSLGENSSTGYDDKPAAYLIETGYGGDAPHDQNQLDSKWTHVGIGTAGKFTDFVFGGKKR